MYLALSDRKIRERETSSERVRATMINYATTDSDIGKIVHSDS